MKRNRGKMILCTALACLCMTSMLPTFSEAAPKNIANATSIRQMREQSHLLKKKNKVSTKTNGITYPDRQPKVKQKSNGITYPDRQPNVKPKSNGITYPDRQPNVKPKSNGITYPDRQPNVKPKTNGITYPDRQPNVKPKSNGITYPDYNPKYCPIDNMEFEIYDELDAEDYLYDMLSSMKGFNFKKNKIMLEKTEDFPAASDDMEWYFGYGARTKGEFDPDRFFAVTEYGEIFEYDETYDDWFILAMPY